MKIRRTHIYAFISVTILLSSCWVVKGFKAVSKIPRNGPVNLDMLIIEGGSFLMGGKISTTVNSFSISATVITEEQYYAVVNTARFSNRVIPHNYPICSVDWLSAVSFCNTLSKREGKTPAYSFRRLPDETSQWHRAAFYKNSVPEYEVTWSRRCEDYEVTWDQSSDGYRLPTEAEWEYAARGGRKSEHDFLYSGGDDADLVAWYEGNSGSVTGTTPGRKRGSNGKVWLHQVATKEPNALGLYDMSGNVWQWCWDWYQEDITGGLNPTGPPARSARIYLRVKRGGSYREDAKYATVLHRDSGWPNENPFSCDQGFRVVRSLPNGY